MNHIGTQRATLMMQVEHLDGLAQFALPVSPRLIEELLCPSSDGHLDLTLRELLSDVTHGVNLACDPLPDRNYDHRAPDEFCGVIHQRGQLLDVYTRPSPLGTVVLLRYGNDTHDYVTAPLGTPHPLVGNALRMIEFRTS